jgi:hypothetical protein
VNKSVRLAWQVLLSIIITLLIFSVDPNIAGISLIEQIYNGKPILNVMGKL